MKRTTVTPEWMGEVRKRMKVNNMTSRDLAAACGWSESVVRKYINGLYYRPLRLIDERSLFCHVNTGNTE